MTDVTLTYHRSTHASLYKRYIDGDFVEVGEDGMYGPVDPETGAQYRVLGGLDHRYNRDYKVGGSYPPAVFVTGRSGGSRSLSHDELEGELKERDLWSDALTPVILPRGYEGGVATWYYGFQFKPVERGPKLDRVESQLKHQASLPENVYRTSTTVEAYL